MDNNDRTALQQLATVWDNTMSFLDRLNSSISVMPKSGFSVLEHSTDLGFPNDICLRIKPVVFNLPEKASHATDRSLFVMLQGRITFDRQLYKTNKELQAVAFSTEVGYFRQRKRALTHVFGAHFDMAPNEPGHPVYHGQIKSFSKWYDEFKGQALFPENCELSDSLGSILANVRIPSAHMDPFSYVLQLGADHLIWRDSAEAEKRTFAELRNSSMKIKGNANRLAQFTPDALKCLRSPHWYPA
ncbi:hypothetical protein [Burkholderia cepacia]|uniref:hypothetical protein n=1 Tax=Burkholderia cepacia TaxID=292 RepID=UPI000B2E4802|nr:hypothetical protein [Burkholderia cepacia]